MTNKQSWEEQIPEVIETLKNIPGKNLYLLDFISSILTSKSELMEGEKISNWDEVYESGFNAGISVCQEILKK